MRGERSDGAPELSLDELGSGTPPSDRLRPLALPVDEELVVEVEVVAAGVVERVERFLWRRSGLAVVLGSSGAASAASSLLALPVGVVVVEVAVDSSSLARGERGGLVRLRLVVEEEVEVAVVVVVVVEAAASLDVGGSAEGTAALSAGGAGSLMMGGGSRWAQRVYGLLALAHRKNAHELTATRERERESKVVRE